MTAFTPANKTPHRLLSLDVFRGITVALMVLVNSPGNPQSYGFLAHSHWNGCSLADLVFPFFIFMVGVSAVFSVQSSRTRLQTRQLVSKILKRSIMLFLCGLLLNAIPHFSWETLRIPGVLQRIAICYFFAAVLELSTSIRFQVALTVMILIAYWLFMAYFPVPGAVVGSLTQESNLAAYVDRLLIPTAHLYQPLYDPEGILSTFPAISTALLGNLTAHILLGTREKNRLCILIILGLSLCVSGWCWGHWFPVNKSLWSSSFVLWSGGLAILAFSFCYWLIDLKKKQKACGLFKFWGANALSLYVFHIIFLKLQFLIHIEREGQMLNFKNYLTQLAFGWASPAMASLLYAVSYLAFCSLSIALYNDWKSKRASRVSIPA